MKNIMLKRMALKAKNRLIGKGIAEVLEDQTCPTTIVKSVDEEFVAKVREIMASEEIVLNPLKQLMDDEAILYMTPMEKERYLLNTLNKYTAARKIIEQEQKKAI